ncbi:thioredoxin [Paenibacillus sp. J31TS4]|uniref:thioredoxin domain-containing protein n=1 Tax=Paenibacillus sp. J31TS4 TaxID=2807195 RepID=UPI001B14CEB9|nr:thioredoxin domain-containing protein [Paenibacillus sp. J31TS4]GIP37049.1 thioredoxin [Paenibacillus sp. J31TS4]
MTQVIENAFLSYGKEDAPVKVEVFLNLACPYCATFFQTADETLTPYLENGQVQYVVKHYDKPREMLLYGTLANAFLDYSDPQRVYQLMKDLFAKQNEWSESDSHSIKRLLNEEYGLQEQPENIDLSLKITAEAIQRQVKMVPTVFVNGKEFQFPVELDANSLKREVEEAFG